MRDVWSLNLDQTMLSYRWMVPVRSFGLRIMKSKPQPYVASPGEMMTMPYPTVNVFPLYPVTSGLVSYIHKRLSIIAMDVSLPFVVMGSLSFTPPRLYVTRHLDRQLTLYGQRRGRETMPFVKVWTVSNSLRISRKVVPLSLPPQVPIICSGDTCLELRGETRPFYFMIGTAGNSFARLTWHPRRCTGQTLEILSLLRVKSRPTYWVIMPPWQHLPLPWAKSLPRMVWMDHSTYCSRSMILLLLENG